MHLHHEAAFDMRGMIVQGVVQSVDDTGQAQTVTVQTADGIIRTDIEVLSMFGHASAPPVAGAVATLLAVGGDNGQYVSLPLCNVSYRFGAMQAGDGGCIYAQDGSRVRIKAGGIVEILGFSTIELASGGNVTIQAPEGGVAITGNLVVQGDLSLTGSGNLTVGGSVEVTGTVTAAAFNTRS